MKSKKIIPALALFGAIATMATGASFAAAPTLSSLNAAEGTRAWWTVVFNPCYKDAEIEYSRGYRGDSIKMKEVTRSGYALLGWSEKYDSSTKMGDSSSYYTIDDTYKIKGAKIKKTVPDRKLIAHAKKFRFLTSDRTVAAVSKSGKIIAKGSGKCKIYVIANNGVSTALKVTVK